MAWPRIKNSRSSAQPGMHPHNGVQASVTPAPDAEPPPGSGQNTGISGTTYAVAQGPGEDGRTVRRPRPIRYAHARAGDSRTADELASDAAPATMPVEITDLPAREDPVPPVREPVADEGLGIFGGVKTTVVPDDESDAPPPPRQPRFHPRPPERHEPAPEPGRADATGATWNQPIAPPPAPANGGAEERKRNPFGMLRSVPWAGEQADDGEPRVSMRDLPPDVQLRFWRLRATIMVIVGAVFAALTRSWEIALTLAILAGIVDTIYRSRNAASYRNGASHPGARRHTSRQLARLRREGYFALDARPIPDSREFIDHLVIGPSGVYAIDSEKWDAKLPVRTLNGKRLYLGPESQKERLEHALWEASQASEILSAALGYDVPVRAALAIYGPKIPWEIATIRNVDVFTGTALRRYLKRRGKTKDGVVPLTREQVRTIYDTASRMLPDVAPSMTRTPVG
ncbi:nuclease-related domain-containing protein [Trebonia kvetii]|nr:nuclease-related domain-containing protein [Trebonia kvetii]